MRIIVTGSRDWRDHRMVYETLLRAYNAHGPITVVHGACRDRHGGLRGADAHANQWAVSMHMLPEQHPADWGSFGNAAGPIRNKEMVDAGADLCLAFVNPCTKARCSSKEPHGSHGAMNCVELARAAGIETRIFREGW